MAEEDNRTTPPDDGDSETPEQQAGDGEQGLGTRSGAVDGPQEGGPGPVSYTHLTLPTTPYV